MDLPEVPALDDTGNDRASPRAAKDVPSPQAERQPAEPGPEPADDAFPLRSEPPDDPVVPWGWLRVVLVLVGFVVVQGLAAVAVVLASYLGESLHVPIEQLAANPAVGLAANVPSIALVWVAWRWLDRRKSTQLGHVGPPTRVLVRMLLGVALGSALMALVVGIGVAAGSWRVSFAAVDSSSGWLVWTPVLLVAAYFEELLVRGYVLQNLARPWPVVGVVASSLLFAVLHLANPEIGDGGVASRLIISLEIALAGLLLAVIFGASRDLWTPVGLHLGWNWTQGLLFGLPVSGITLPSIGHAEMVGNDLVSGTSFGPESSLIAVGVTAAAVLVALVVVRRRGWVLPIDDQAPGRS